MATYPTDPALPQGVAGTDVDPTNWNKFVDNINAIGADLVDARGDGQTFPGTPYTSGQSNDFDDAMQAVRCMIKDISGETNWYDQVATSLAVIARTSITFGNDDTTPSISTAARPVGMCHTATGNSAAIDVLDLDDGVDGQVIIVIGASPTHKTTLKAQSEEPTSNLILRSDWLEGDGVAIALIYDSAAGEWIEISRSPEESSGGTGDDIDITTKDASLGTQTVNLPTAVGKLDDLYAVVKTDSSAYKVIVDPSGAETISGAAKYLLRKQYEAVGMISDGANWLKVCGSGTILDVRDFGATGDGTTDDTTAIQAAISAAGARGVLYFPAGNYYVSGELDVTNNLHVLGDGGSTMIYQSSTSLNLFHFTGNGAFRIENLFLAGEQTTAGKCLIRVEEPASHGVIRNITMDGGYYGIGLYGSLFIHIENPRNASSGFYRSVSAQNVAWIYGERYASHSVNGLMIDHPVFQSGGTKGIVLTDSNNEGDALIQGGCIEGMPAGGVGIYISDYQQGVTIENVHLEDTYSKIELTSCKRVKILDCYNPGVSITSSEDIQIDHCKIGSGGEITTSGTVTGLVVTNCEYADIANMDIDARAARVESMIYASNASIRGRGTYLSNRSYRSICDGDLEAWAGGVPIGFGVLPTAAAVVEETGTVRFGSKSAKVIVPAAQTTAWLTFAMDTSKYDRTEAYYLHAVTVKAWVYKPSVNGFDPVIRMYYGGTPADAPAFTSLNDDEWTPVIQSFTMSTGLDNPMIRIGTHSASPGEYIYVDGVEILEGETCTPMFDDSRGIDGNFRVGGSFLQAGEVGTMSGNETFIFGDGDIFIKDPGGAARNLDPSGDFPPLVKVTVINTADAAETITFDSGGLAEAVAQNERGIFVYDGSNWLKVYTGS